MAPMGVLGMPGVSDSPSLPELAETPPGPAQHRFQSAQLKWKLMASPFSVTPHLPAWGAAPRSPGRVGESRLVGRP